MVNRTIHPRRAEITADIANEAVSDAIVAVKEARGLTDARFGHRVSRNGDAVQAWRVGESKMSVAALLTSIAEYGPEFGDSVVGLAGYRLVPVEGAAMPDATLLASVGALLTALASGDADALRKAAQPVLSGLTARVERS